MMVFQGGKNVVMLTARGKKIKGHIRRAFPIPWVAQGTSFFD